MEGTTTFYQLSAYTGQAQQIITCSIKAKAVRGMYSKLLKTRVLVELEDGECDGGMELVVAAERAAGSGVGGTMP